MRTLVSSLLTLGIVIALSAFSSARADVTVSAKLTTLGVGLEFAAPINDQAVLRIGGNLLDLSYENEVRRVDYEGDTELRTVGALFDWYLKPGGRFHLTGGVMWNDSRFDLSARGNRGTYELNGVDYRASQVGRLRATAEFDTVAPYAGVGWKWPTGVNGAWTWFVEAGLLYQGKPDVTLTADGVLSNDPIFRSDLRAAEQDAEDDLGFRFYPVIGGGISYRF